MSPSPADFPYVIGFYDIENAKLITLEGAEQQDMDALGVLEDLKQIDENPDNDQDRVVYGPRYEQFEQELEEHESDISGNLSGFDYETVIYELVEKNPTTLNRFLPEDLQDRIDQRWAGIPEIRPENPETTKNVFDARAEAAREEVEKYEEPTEDLVNYNEIKRNTTVVYAEEFNDLIKASEDAFMSKFD